jgi:hypothetical protein
MSKQKLHIPQLGLLQPSHAPQRDRLMPLALGVRQVIANASAAPASSATSQEAYNGSGESEQTHRSGRSPSVTPSRKRHLSHASHWLGLGLGLESGLG